MPKRKLIVKSDPESDTSDLSSVFSSDVESDAGNIGGSPATTTDVHDLSALEYTKLLLGLTAFVEVNAKLFKVDDNRPTLVEEFVNVRGSKLETERWFWQIRHVRSAQDLVGLLDELVSYCLTLKAEKKGFGEFIESLPTSFSVYLRSKHAALKKLSKVIDGPSKKKQKKTAEGRREKDPEGYARKLSDAMRLKVTGARKGETIIGYGGIAGGTQLIVLGCDVPPVYQDVGLIRQHPEVWDKFLTKLGQEIEFFRSMPTNTARADYLLSHAEPEDSLHMSDMPSVAFQILQLGSNENMAKLDEATKTMLASRAADDPIGGDEFAKCFPAKLGSVTDHHTLMFGRGYWKVLDRDPLVRKIGKDCVVFNLSRRGEQALMMGPVQRAAGEELFEMRIVDDDFGGGVKQAACLFNLKGTQLDLRTLAKEFDIADETLTRFQSATCHLPASALKSLLQKIIRFRPEDVDLHDNLPPLAAETVLTITFLSLLCHSGGFVPDIQRFVSGLEAAAKRLAIIAFEDSYPSNARTLAELMVAAFICQRYKTWRPTLQMVKEWVQVAIALWEDGRCVEYDIQKGSDAKVVTVEQAVKKADSYLLSVTAVLDLVRSFSGDLGMVRWFATTPETKWNVINRMALPSHCMPLAHCVDQHWAPNFVYLLQPLNMVYELCAKGGTKVFGGILSKVFDEVTGVNPRRVKKWGGSTFEKGDWVTKVRKAQRGYILAAISRGGTAVEDPMDVDADGCERIKEKYVVQTSLPDAWLAGMLGTVEVKKGKMLAALVPDDITRVVVAKRPSVRASSTTAANNTGKDFNGSKGSAASASAAAGIREDKETLEGEREFWGMLAAEDGVPLAAISVTPLAHLKGARMKVVDGEISLHLKGKGWTTWTEAKRGRVELDVFGTVDSSDGDDADGITHFDYISAHLEPQPHGVKSKAMAIFLAVIDSMLNRYPTAVRRFLSYIARNEPLVEIAQIGRDGGGTEGAVTADDAGAYHIFASLSVLFPGAIKKGTRIGSFQISCAPVIWEVREKVEAKLAAMAKILQPGKTGKQQNQDVWNTGALGDRERRHFLWLPPGAGKTKIVSEFMLRLANSGQLPPFVVYCLTKESMMTIVDELRIYGFNVRIVAGFAAAAKRYGGDADKGTPPVDYVPETIKATQKTLTSFGGILIKGDGTGLKHQGYVHIVEHDHLRVLASLHLLPTAGSTMFIIDEVHLAMADTLRTAAAQSMADNCSEFVAMTGTPIVDSNLYRLVPWLRYLVPFTVTERNFWCAATSMVARKVETRIPRAYENILLGVDDMTTKEQEEWKKLMPRKLGGLNRHAGSREFMKAAVLSYELATREMVKRAIALLEIRKGVMIIAKDTAHAQQVAEAIPLPSKQKVLMTGHTSVNLTPSSNPNNVRVVVVPYRRATGYTLTALDTIVWTVYPSNQAVRTQLEARIDRVGQTAKDLLYTKVLTPLFEVMEEKHSKAKTLEEALKAMVDEI
ncbi:hypothetical protein HK097_000494 [Rhizophlyctis rosea]|uniref:Helicase/UvrB N-terminal domain-containing protein n=1 Tax=Rhizophlyctis rosea TaxID=64517 RepID=A0AAD5WYT5_9FUNG|nr:hypothetical protein HK097_000494 [Rhizophlyctis rosea]